MLACGPDAVAYSAGRVKLGRHLRLAGAVAGTPAGAHPGPASSALALPDVGVSLPGPQLPAAPAAPAAPVSAPAVPRAPALPVAAPAVHAPAAPPPPLP